MKTDDVRRLYLEFFEGKKHKVLPSDSLIPENDETLLFTSAGMNQFKKQFMGKNIKYSKVTTCQKCLRTGDLEKVGKTPYHHTFFEMLGNFSFGDYFKKEAIGWAWEFLTEILKIRPELLWVSVYEDDKEAYDAWRDIIKVPKERIIECGDKDNYWPPEAILKGPNGPCGPCSEIYYDKGKNYGCTGKDCKPGCSCKRFIEIWNLVFTQFKREGAIGKKGRLVPLPNKNIDTGMGLERMAQVMQGVDSNFEIDIFKALTDYIANNIEKGNAQNTASVNVISDHIRAAVFAIGDGVIPSNEERGYVIRKLIRNSKFMLLHLGIKEPFLYKLAPLVVESMKNAYPELEKRHKNIASMILEEEKKYDELMHALPLREKEFRGKNIKNSADAGIKAFEFYDTFGIPKDITIKWAENILGKNYKEGPFNAGYKVDMDAQRERARKGSQIKNEIFTENFQDEIAGLKPTIFLGYEKLESKGRVLAILDKDKKVTESGVKDEIGVILNQTPFYAAGGGQAADRGILKGKNFEAEVRNVEAVNSIYIHTIKLESGKIKVNDSIAASVDKERRLATAKNHTATHLLQAALRSVLGTHIEQAGSLVDEKRLRFDFTHFKQVSTQELKRVEELVNTYIRNNDNVGVNIMSLDEAKKKNILAFFKEKYGKTVRVVKSGGYSRELCAGTHIDSTGSIGLFKIISENSIASGTRRIEAVTAKEAIAFINEKGDILRELEKLFKVDSVRIYAAAQELFKENQRIKKELNGLKMNSLKDQIDIIISKAKTKKNIKIVTYKFDDFDMNSLRLITDMIKDKLKTAIIVLASVLNNRVNLIAALSDDLVKKGLNAHEIIQILNKELGSKGGGRPNLAQAGGGNPSKLKSVLDKVDEIIL